MTLRFFDGFEGGPSNAKSDWLVAGTVVSTNVRTGVYALQSNTAGARLNVTASAKITTGFAYFNSGPAAGGGRDVVSFYGDSNTTQHLTLTLNTTSLLWELRRGAFNGTLLATGTYVQETSVQRNFQIQATIADSGGTFIFKVDGVTDITFTGDTKNGGTSTNIDAINYMAGASNSNGRLDDLWVCDGVDATATQGRTNNDFLGDLKVNVHNPTAAGDLTQWTPSAGANYTDVDDVPANTTDYVSSSTAGNKDLYVNDDLPAGAVTVYGVQVMAHAQKTDSGSRGMKTVIKENSTTTAEASSHALSTSWVQYNSPIIAVKPSNSAVFAPSDVNAMQIGVECEAS